MRKRIAKYGFIIGGSLLIVNGVAAALMSNLHAGMIFTAALGAILLAMGIFFNRLPRWAVITAAVCLCTAGISVASLFVVGSVDNVTYGEEALIVLGAGVDGELPTRTLSSRLEKAVEYLERNPGCVVVVTGGRGPGEDITEALAMERYLVENGISPDRIIKEELSTGTAENFQNAKALLDSRLGEDLRVAVITGDYHIIRACMIAKETGFASVTHLSADTQAYMILPCGLRELLALAKQIIIG